MKTDLPSHLHTSIESICELGCDRVNEIIAALECGKSVAETDGLDQSERQSLLRELKDIMAVYDTDSA